MHEEEHLRSRLRCNDRSPERGAAIQESHPSCSCGKIRLKPSGYIKSGELRQTARPDRTVLLVGCSQSLSSELLLEPPRSGTILVDGKTKVGFLGNTIFDVGGLGIGYRTGKAFDDRSRNV